MAMKITVESHIDVPKHLAKVRDKEFWTFAATEYHRLMTPYVPFETGTLNETVKIKGGELTGEIKYHAPHAHYIYEGRTMGPSYYNPDYGFWSPPGQKKHYTGKSLDFSKNKHSPLASAHWDKAAEPTQKPKLIEAMQDYVDSGRLNLND